MGREQFCRTRGDRPLSFLRGRSRWLELAADQCVRLALSVTISANTKFARIVFYLAAVWGILILTPLYFMFDLIGRQDPPPITHPAFYYGFASVALAWQFAFIVIARDPIRFRLMMIPSVIEKFAYGACLLALYFQHRLHGADVAFGSIDILFGVLFLVAYARTSG